MMEDFGYRSDNESKKIPNFVRKIFMLIATFFSIGIFIYITLSAYYFVYDDKDANIETIKSPDFEIKVVTENVKENDLSEESGMKINSQIYEDIFGNKKEILSQKNIKPIDYSNNFLPPEKVIKEFKTIKDLQQEEYTNKQDNQVDKEIKEEIKKNNQDSGKNEKIIIYSNEESKKDNQKTKNVFVGYDKESRDNTSKKEPQNTTRKKSGVRVQIAAMTSQELAEKNWRVLNRLHPELFSSLDYFVEKVDLGARGVFYRLQVGIFSNQVLAEEFCDQYIAKTQKKTADCIVVE